MTKRGIFIAFEGIDGCGKSTQIRKLVEHIFEKNKHNHIILTRNPYKDKNIRSILTEDEDPLTQANKLADLFISDRKTHASELILPNLEKGHFVVTDRYKLSTITYQAAQGIPMQSLIDKHLGLPIPDMTFVIDVSANEASQRMKKENVSIRGKEHKFEANLDFLENVRQNHHKALPLLQNEKIFIINGEKTPEIISQEIKNIFDREFERLQNNISSQ